MDKDLMRAMQLQNNGHHAQAAHVYRNAANKERPVAEKELLRKAADRAMKVAYSD